MEERIDVMIDLETLGTDPDCIILSIGVCGFDIMTGQIIRTLYNTISMESQDHIRTVSGGTIRWWMDQSKEAKQVFNESNYHLQSALYGLSTWLEPYSTVWGNGATFDISILEDAYAQHKIEIPWPLWNIRDVRTICDVASHLVYKKDFEFTGTPHNALDDAVHQAKYVSAMWRALKGKNNGLQPT